MNVSLELEFTQVFHATGSIPNTTGVDLRRKALFAASVAQFSFTLLLQLLV